MKTLVLPRTDAVREIAAMICDAAASRKNAAIGIGLGFGYEDIFAAVASEMKTRGTSFSGVRIFELCSYSGSAGSDFSDNIDLLIGSTDLEEKNVFRLTESSCADFMAEVERSGGLDLAVTEIGVNGALGLIEPVAEFSSLPGICKLFTVTRQEKTGYFGSLDNVPEYAVTTGIYPISRAEKVIGVSFGTANAEAVYKTVYARNDGIVPSAYLQVFRNSCLAADTMSGSKLT